MAQFPERKKIKHISGRTQISKEEVENKQRELKLLRKEVSKGIEKRMRKFYGKSPV